jgi:phage anti-repressor protein
MISFVEHQNGEMINSKVLYNGLGLNSSHYDRWMDDNLIQLSEIEYDYIVLDISRAGVGRPRKEYLITIEYSKTLCTLAKTKKAIELRRWLINYQISDSLQK